MSKKRKSDSGGRRNHLPKLKSRVLTLLDNNPDEAYSLKQIKRKLGFKRKDIVRQVPEALDALKEEGRIEQLNGEMYKSNRGEVETVGVVDHVNSRFAYIICEGLDDDVYVKTDDLLNAWDGDKVKIHLFRHRKGRRPEGKVTEVIERSKTSFVGKIEFSENFAFVIPDNRKLHEDIYVKKQDIKGANDNDKVLVEITSWPQKGKSAEGKVVQSLGPAGENEAEIHSIMAEFGLPFSFPEAITKAAEEIPVEITKKDIEERRDLREVTTFTIDPVDAKDFDDALSVRKMDNGHWEIGVHIADVTHYLKEGTSLDKEAYKRGTSVYLVDRTIPMLPEKISNFLCSLRPREDKLTYSAIFELDEEGKVYDRWFGRTIIHSDRRFTYEEAQAVLEAGIGDHAQELALLNKIHHILRRKRFESGAVNFETTEVRFKLDENGKPLGIVPKIRQDAHKLIEEFMLLANREVATFVYKMLPGKNKNTFVYRTHDFPDPEKVGAFAQFAKKFGHSLQVEKEEVSKSLNNLLAEIEGKPEENVLQSLAIRSMAKAKYSTEEEGHFGLAFKHYSHFTSPIRRYPDVMVHRLLDHYLNNGKSVERDPYEQKCEHTSEREKVAADAERASIKYKQVEYMSTMLDKEFEGLISGVTEWGLYVEIIETKCEGMVRLADLTDDFYQFDEENYRVVGFNNKKIYTLGDKVNVRVTDTNIDRRTIDLELVND
ncbi:MAG: ribonuclease R [Candidatus Cyclobacteriaceae bacterium M2_1C_046]